MTNKLIDLPKQANASSFPLQDRQVEHLTFTKYHYLVDGQLTVNRLTLPQLNNLLKDLNVSDVQLVDREEGARLLALVETEKKKKEEAEKKRKAAEAEKKRKAAEEKKKAETKKKDSEPAKEVEEK